MKYLRQGKFSVAAPDSDAYRDNWDRIFRPSPAEGDPGFIGGAALALLEAHGVSEQEAREYLDKGTVPPGFGYGWSSDCDDPNGGPCGCGAHHPVKFVTIEREDTGETLEVIEERERCIAHCTCTKYLGRSCCTCGAECPEE